MTKSLKKECYHVSKIRSCSWNGVYNLLHSMSNAIQVDTISTFATLMLMKEPVHHSKADARPSICELKPLIASLYATVRNPRVSLVRAASSVVRKHHSQVASWPTCRFCLIERPTHCVPNDSQMVPTDFHWDGSDIVSEGF